MSKDASSQTPNIAWDKTRLKEALIPTAMASNSSSNPSSTKKHTHGNLQEPVALNYLAGNKEFVEIFASILLEELQSRQNPRLQGLNGDKHSKKLKKVESFIIKYNQQPTKQERFIHAKDFLEDYKHEYEVLEKSIDSTTTIPKRILDTPSEYKVPDLKSKIPELSQAIFSKKGGYIADKQFRSLSQAHIQFMDNMGKKPYKTLNNIAGALHVSMTQDNPEKSNNLSRIFRRSKRGRYDINLIEYASNITDAIQDSKSKENFQAKIQPKLIRAASKTSFKERIKNGYSTLPLRR